MVSSRVSGLPLAGGPLAKMTEAKCNRCAAHSGSPAKTSVLLDPPWRPQSTMFGSPLPLCSDGSAHKVAESCPCPLLKRVVLSSQRHLMCLSTNCRNPPPTLNFPCVSVTRQRVPRGRDRAWLSSGPQFSWEAVWTKTGFKLHLSHFKGF